MGFAGVGMPQRVQALGEEAAILLATEACLDDACSSVGGEGLWLVEYDSGTGLSYTPIPFTPVSTAARDRAISASSA